MKAIIRGFCMALVTVASLTVVGCGPDNEGESQTLGAKAGDPGAPTTGEKAEIVAPAKTQKEHFERAQSGQDKMKKETGAKK